MKKCYITDVRVLFVLPLKNADVMENQALSIMKPQVSRIGNDPELAQRLEAQTTETQCQVGRMEGILSSSSGSCFSIKDVALSFGGTMAVLGHSVTDNGEVDRRSCRQYRPPLHLAKAGGFSAKL